MMNNIKLIPIELTAIIKNKKIKQISCRIDEYTSEERITKHTDKEYEFDTGEFVIEFEDKSLLAFSNSEWGFATYYENLDELIKKETI